MLKRCAFQLFFVLAAVLGPAESALADDHRQRQIRPGCALSTRTPDELERHARLVRARVRVPRSAGRDPARRRTGHRPPRAAGLRGRGLELLRERLGRERRHAADPPVAGDLHVEVRSAQPRLRRRRVDGRADRHQSDRNLSEVRSWACSPRARSRAAFSASWTTSPNVRVLFDLFYPGVLPGSAVDVPPGINVVTQIVSSCDRGDDGGSLRGVGDREDLPDARPVRAREWPGARSSRSRRRLWARPATRMSCASRTGSHSSTTFPRCTRAPSPRRTLLWINANVQRFSASPSGLNFVRHNYTPTGDLRIPALTLSTFRDPVVPGFHQAAYGAAVAAAGGANWLVQRSVLGTGNGYGHCTFTPQELVTAFTDLVLWAEHGVKPVP